MAQFRWPQIFLRNLRVFGHYGTNYPRHWSFLPIDWQIPLLASTTSYILPESLVRILTLGVDRWNSSSLIHRDEKITKKVLQHFSNWITTNVTTDSTLSHSKKNSQFLSNFFFFLILTFPGSALLYRQRHYGTAQLRNYRGVPDSKRARKSTIIQLRERVSRKFFNKFSTFL